MQVPGVPKRPTVQVVDQDDSHTNTDQQVSKPKHYAICSNVPLALYTRSALQHHLVKENNSLTKWILFTLRVFSVDKQLKEF